MSTADLPFGDRRTLQASGPFTLTPGAVNELIIGVVWVGNQNYPNPSIRRLQQADDLAQSLFDNCFDICDGPDAPDVDILELDREIILLLSNDPGSNNANESYNEPGLGIPDSVTINNVRVQADSLYRFEGYRVFQFANSSVSLADIEDPDLVREVAQFDVENNVTRVFDWNAIDGDDNPLPGNFFVPELQVSGRNAGINRSIRITSDAFGVGDQTQLVNHRQYYFTVIAYGYNNYKEYNPLNTEEPGQRQQYKPSSRNIGDSRTGNAFYTVIPRPILDQNLMADYGDAVQIRRLAGEGNGGQFLDIDTVTRQDMEQVMRDEAAYEEDEYGFDGEVTYQTGAGPIEVFVSNPFNVRDGEYEIRIIDELADGDELADNARWTLRCLDDCGVETIMSERPISELNEQLVSEFGFSVVIRDVPEPGTPAGRRQNNGAIGQSLEYADPDGDRWLSFVPDGTPGPFLGTAIGSEIYNYVNTGETEEFQAEDSMQAYAELFNGVYPFALMDWTRRANVPFFFSPVWLEGDAMARVASGLELEDLNNVDIVFTSDKSLWSRCPIVETATPYFDDVVIDGEEIAAGKPIQFDTRDARSVTRQGGPDGLPTVDDDIGADLANGMGWFPGYAIDVETGQRLEIFFGENSLYDGRLFDEDNPDLGTTPGNGADMMFNPSSTLVISPPSDFGSLPFSYVSGGHHYFYVTTEPYDRGVNLERRLEPRGGQFTRKVQVLRNITWAGFPLLTAGTELLSYEDGLIPNDVRLKLRVNNDFDYAEGIPEVSDDYPTYQFTIESNAATELSAAEADNSLDRIQIVPNPYYGFSAYENSALDNRVKITNLPNTATVTIYSLDGKFIRQYDRDITPTELRGSSRPFGQRQTVPSLDWDLRNFRGIPVASGVYLVHVAVPGVGERTLKWFGVQREFDPSGL